MSRHWEKGPHGDGLHGSRYKSCCGGTTGASLRDKMHRKAIRVRCFIELLTWLWVTSCKWISCVSVHAITDWTVIVDATFRVLTASTRTWIDTFLIWTSFVVWTFRAHNALRSTAGWASDISWKTRTNTLVVNFTTLRVGAARRWRTWINICWCNRWMNKIVIEIEI